MPAGQSAAEVEEKAADQPFPTTADEGGRRQAKRRPAGPSRPSIAANDDVPSIGGLIFALHQKPSRRPLEIAAIASIVWALLGVLLGWAMLAPELQRAPTFWEMLTRPTAITLAATVLIPIALFWLLALLSWRAQELRLMSSAMTEVAIRLAEPDRMAEQQIASVGQAVRRQVSFMDEAVSRALGRAGEIEALVHNEVANLERSYAQNEQRLRGLLQELSGERHALLNTSERVNVALKELGTEIPVLVAKLGDQQVKLARFIQDAGQNLVSLETAMATSTNQLAQSVGTRTQELNTVLTTHAQGLEASLSGHTQQLQGLLTDGTQQIAGLLTDRTQTIQGTLGEATQTLQETLGGATETLRETLDSRGSAMQAVVGEQTERIAGLISDGTQRLETALTKQSEDVQAIIAERTEEMQSLFDGFSGGLDQALGARTEGLQAVLEEYTRALDAALANREEALGGLLASGEEKLGGLLATGEEKIGGLLAAREQGIGGLLATGEEKLGQLLDQRQQALDQILASRQDNFESQLVERTRALDEAFSERLKLFDDTIVRSTIAVDSMVADKARALSSALETHAREIGQVLGRQAGELDEQLMHGVNAVRRASENVTRQSLKAIEGLAGQADLLKNVSENLLNQISSVTGRFDQQGQMIMRAANALESANYKIDKTLQNRQTELTDTLEQLSTKASQIDQTIRNYPTALDGAFSEAESRARLVGDHLSRTAEERARAVRGELERLEASTVSETDRALADLRAKYSSVTREVADEIGSLTSRFAETSDDMRRRAQSTLAEIEGEQARLKEQLERLPEATRQSADTMRASLQEQLKALEQLSTLSTREAARDVSPPLSLPAAQPAQPSQPSPPPRSISSLTQSLATEMASRGRAAAAQAPTPQPAHTASPAPTQLVPLPAAPTASPAPRDFTSAFAPATPAAPVARPPQPAASAFPAAPARPALPPAQSADPGREGWSLGDLLARASHDDDHAPATPAPAAAAASPQAPAALPPPVAAATASGGINIHAISGALDATTASAIWSRFRAGQRGIMVRSIYSAEGRTAFDEVQRRVKTDPTFLQTVERYMSDFEVLLRDADQRDPSGRQAQSFVVSESGRVYLFLAHACGRLA